MKGLSSTFWLALAALCQALAGVALGGSTKLSAMARECQRRAQR